MTHGVIVPNQERVLVRIQERGQVTVPAAMRRKLGLKKGDLVSVVETADGVFIAPQGAAGAKDFNRTGRTMAEQGVSMEQLLSSEPTMNRIPLREYSAEEIAKFIQGDRLTDEQRAVVKRFGRKGAR